MNLTGSIVLYNNPFSQVALTIKSFLSTPSLNLILYLIDNSPLPSLQKLANIDNRIIYIHNGKNIGFGSGHNLAMRLAEKLKSKYHVVVNPDIFHNENVLFEMYSFMEKNESVGILSPKILYPNGDIQYLQKYIPSPATLFFRRFVPKKITEKLFANYEIKNLDSVKTQEIPFVSGCFMSTRLTCILNEGGFDDRYFMYMEDLDLCRKVSKSYKILYYPTVFVFHEYKKGSYKNYKLLKYHFKSAFKYFNKWGWLNDKDRILTNKRIKDNLQTLQF